MAAADPPRLGARRLIGRRGPALLRDALLVLACVAAPLGFALAALSARVEGPSMEPRLRSGDVLLVNRLPIGQGQLQRGDVVVLRLGAASAVKRLIGLPGDGLEIDHGVVLLRPGDSGPWRRLAEPYAPGPRTINAFCCDDAGRATRTGSGRPFVVPRDRYFVLGDNRDDSDDSRTFGAVPRAWIVGPALVRYWPPARFGPVAEPVGS